MFENLTTIITQDYQNPAKLQSPCTEFEYPDLVATLQSCIYKVVASARNSHMGNLKKWRSAVQISAVTIPEN